MNPLEIFQRLIMVMLGNFKTQEMCIKAVEKDPWHLYYVPDPFKTQKIYDDAV